MTALTHGSLFTGYGGLDMAVEAATGARTVWHCEFEPPTEKAPNPKQAGARLLAHRFPAVPNHGDVTKVRWTPDCPTCGDLLALYDVGADGHLAYWCRVHGESPLSIRTADVVEPVDVLSGGSPCQDVSAAGKRAGMRAGTRSGLWASMVDAIQLLRPRLVVWENVRGVLSADADSALEPCPGCVGDGQDVHALRALGRVLGDLADIGYDTSWYGLPASAVGAPHQRWREFVVAWPADSDAVALRRWSEGRHDGLRAAGLVEVSAANADEHERGGQRPQQPGRAAAANADEHERGGQRPQQPGRAAAAGGGGKPAADAGGDRQRTLVGQLPTGEPNADGRAAAHAEGKRRQAGSVGVGVEAERPVGHGDRRAAADADGDGQRGVGWVDPVGPDADGRGGADRAGRDGEPETPAADATGVGRGEGWAEPAGVVGRSDAAERGCDAAPDAYGHPLRQQPVPVGERGGATVAGLAGTEAAADSAGGGCDGRAQVEVGEPLGRAAVAWGDYEPAVRRWERLTRPAPMPTEQNWAAWRRARAARRRSKRPVGFRGSVAALLRPPSHQLNPEFSEWMMGLPAGHVTAVPGLTRNEKLKLIGNGVVPQQAFVAINEALAFAPSWLLDLLRRALVVAA